MTEPPENQPRRNGITASLAALGNQLITILPPAFLLLIIMNVMFLGMVIWVSDRNAEVRNELLTKIVEKCLLTTPRQ